MFCLNLHRLRGPIKPRYNAQRPGVGSTEPLLDTQPGLEVAVPNSKANRLIDAAPNKYLGEYRVWLGMLARCYTRSDPFYKDYGAKGITVCKRWRLSFDNFLADMGPRPPNHWIALIRPSRNYCKSNCVWMYIGDVNRLRAKRAKRQQAQKAARSQHGKSPNEMVHITSR